MGFPLLPKRWGVQPPIFCDIAICSVGLQRSQLSRDGCQPLVWTPRQLWRFVGRGTPRSARLPGADGMMRACASPPALCRRPYHQSAHPKGKQGSKWGLAKIYYQVYDPPCPGLLVRHPACRHAWYVRRGRGGARGGPGRREAATGGYGRKPLYVRPPESK